SPLCYPRMLPLPYCRPYPAPPWLTVGLERSSLATRGGTRRRPRRWAGYAGDFTDDQSAARSVCRFLAGDGDDAVADDRGTAADADLGDLAVLLAGCGVEQAGAVHGDALIDEPRWRERRTGSTGAGRRGSRLRTHTGAWT